MGSRRCRVVQPLCSGGLFRSVSQPAVGADAIDVATVCIYAIEAEEAEPKSAKQTEPYRRIPVVFATVPATVSSAISGGKMRRGR